MKQTRENIKNANPKLWEELNEVLEKYKLGNVHIDSIRLKGGKYTPTNCRKVCRRRTNPKTGEVTIRCTLICN